MSTHPYQLTFEASANLQRLLGRELIPNDEMAVIELVKNSYDSGAHNITILIQPERAKEPSYIELRDDGEGMTIENIRQHFMFAGYSSRPEQVNRRKRIPTGEKGIGRFASDKLGKELTVLTKARSDSKGIRLQIDWEAFRNKKKRFSDIKALYSVEPIPRLASGTILIITGLRSEWSESKVSSLRKSLAELLDPFYKSMNFRIDLEIPSSPKLSGPIVQERPGRADMDIEFWIKKNGQAVRSIAGKQYRGGSGIETINSAVDTSSLAGLKGRFFYTIDRPHKDFTKGIAPGVRLFRDGFRIEPFGSPAADWLGIAAKRAKRAGHAHVVPSRLFGFVEISRREHQELTDTTSRQALLDGEAARALVTFLGEQVRFLEETIRKQISEPRWKESKTRQAVEFEQAKLQTLSIMSFGLAHELRQPLQVIRTEADNIVTRLGQLGISDQTVHESQGAIDAGIERIDKNIEVIADISRGNTDAVETFDLADLVRRESALFSQFAAPRGIKIDIHAPAKHTATFNRFIISSVLLNLLSNAVSAIGDLGSGHDGKIEIELRKNNKQHIVVVTDNGVGISGDIRNKIFKKFATKKTGGMGVGLYLCKVMLTSHGGTIDFASQPNAETSFTVKFKDLG